MFIENGPNSYANKPSKVNEPKSSLLDNRSNNINEFSNARSYNTNTNEGFGLEGSRQKSKDKNMNYQQQRFKYSNKR